MSGWASLRMTPAMLCWNDMYILFTDRYPFITASDIILVGEWVRNKTKYTMDPGIYFLIKTNK